MNFIFDIINVPLGYVLKFFAMLFGNSYAASVFVFTIFINLVLLPLTLKSQKSSVSQLRIKPKLDELKKKYGDDKQRYSQEMQNLYTKENIKMSGGCLPMLIRMLLVFSVFSLIASPLTYLLSDSVTPEIIGNLTKQLAENDQKSYYAQLFAVTGVQNGTIAAEAGVKAAINSLNFDLFGLDLTEIPQWNWNVIEGWKPVWLIPISAFAAQMLTSILSMVMQKRTNPDAPSMAGMMLTMPLISLFIGFTVPAAVGFYWACSSLIGGLLQTAMQYFYSPQKMLATERAKEITAVYEAEQKYITGRKANGDK